MSTRTRVPALAALLAALLAATSCATYQVRSESVPTMPPNAQAFQGKTIGIEPTSSSFGASRFTIDLRDATITVNGAELQLERRYLAKDEDLTLGKVGVLDVDLFGKTKVDKAALAAFCQDLLVKGAMGAHDYHVPFFKGFGEYNMGDLSNRPVQQDRSTYPAKTVFADGPGAAPLFSSAVALGSGSAAGVDLVLKSDISLSSEILEVLEPPTSGISPDASPVRKGDYFLSLFGSYRFSLADAGSGAVLVSEKTKSEWLQKPVLVRYMRVPVPTGDAAAYAKYFRTVDFNSYAREACALALENALPLLAPFYVNTYHAEKVEKQ